MPPRIKVVIDANVIISSIISGGIPSKALLWSVQFGSAHRPPQMENELFAFLDEIKERPGRKGCLLSEKQWKHVKQFFIDFLKQAKPHQPSHIQHYSRDQSDNVYIAVALEMKAQFLITGDKDLLSLKNRFETLKIVNPREFLQLMENIF